MIRPLHLWIVAGIVGCCACPAVMAKTLEVGANHQLKMSSAAAAVAGAGDTIEIESGEYFDCAVWNASRLTIVGKAPGVIITDRTCQGKALFVTVGNDITIRNITFTRAHVPDGNGAGIRAEGKNLTVEHARFVNNENGIVAGELPRSTVKIADSEFLENGKCEAACATAFTWATSPCCGSSALVSSRQKSATT
jgi:pectate lyase